MYGGLELWLNARKRGGIEVLAKEGPRIADRGIEAWRCRVWSAGGALRYGGTEIWRSGGSVGVGIEVWGYRALV